MIPLMLKTKQSKTVSLPRHCSACLLLCNNPPANVFARESVTWAGLVGTAQLSAHLAWGRGLGWNHLQVLTHTPGGGTGYQLGLS